VSEQVQVEQRPEFPVLDTLRAVGALAVLTTHTTFQSGEYGRHGVVGTLFSRLDVGVAIFFVLSGFLLSRPYFARAMVHRGHPSTGRYYWKRFLRIYPVYAVTVVLALALIDENRGLGAVQWVRSLLLVDIYTSARLPQGLTQMWSLAVEAMFYLTLPLLMLAALGRGGGVSVRRVSGVLAGLCAISVWWVLSLGGVVSESAAGVPMTWLPSYLTWFAVGIALALAHVLHQARGSDAPRAVRRLTTVGAMPGVCWALVAGLLLVAATPIAGPSFLFVASPGEALTKHLLYAGIGGLVVVTGIFTAPGSRYAAVMSTPALRHLGVISYSTFCIHLPVLHLVMSVTDYGLFQGHGLQIWALTLVVSLVASELLYRLVEKPGMRLNGLRAPWARSSTSQPKSTATTTTTR
jgi:peptidoglycan/LPS O-acetylase OafA/YrhL